MQDGVATFANSPWTTAMPKYLEMNQSGCFQQNPLGTNYEASRTWPRPARRSGWSRATG